ncbi:hypothetical protein EV356DRAFT_503793 [Viridothelium virens]|uniref:Phosphatidate phosphatase APP1 catalytic domain-containing protein n=1 Tax=Viridothelium virens TaxID=1048519 RepID=A0A6A6H547_VIRVR|nr:hypothetical protein EV356DRAFT_503793 [Viridothelium virens]
MSSSGNYGSEGYNSLTGFGSGGAREPGARRKKLAGYLRAANELRQSYQQSYGSSFNVASSDGSTDHLGNDMPGAFPEAAIVRGRDEEMVIFPSYARNHTKKKQWEAAGPETSGMAPQDPYSMRDPDYWRYQEERYEEEIDAVVDVDVRGWLYSPQKGPMNRKQRLFIGLARQLSGLPAPPTSTISPTTSRSSSRSSSPHTLHRQRMEMRVAKQEEEEVSKEAQAILKRGEKEADIAGRGGFSEFPSNNGGSFADGPSRELSSPSHTRKQEPQPGRIPHPVTETPLTSDSTSPISAADRRQSWTDPAKMSPAELTEANNHLMARLRPFLANPLVDTAVSAFFFNESNSEQRTIPTDTSGHFSIRAALTFVPTHVRLLASEGGLSALQEVHVTQPQGISLISDIDDTIKHSAITAGAKEIFRNTFIRSLDDLTVEGVREWYKRMADMGVKLHYVSNSPWQLYPLLASYFAKAELPKGSFHLKQYAGVLQGIFEPVAERKKSTMDRLLHDFPDRQFILVGDSGEADLEVYTNTVLENPGRILGIFIRDVTTTKRRRFFDSTMGPLRGEYSPGSGTASPNSWQRSSRGLPQTNDEDDPDLRTAIAASLEDVEKQRHRSIGSIQSSHATQSGPQLRPIEKGENRPRLPPRRPTEPPAPPSHQMGPTMGTLIDLSEPELPTNQASSASAKHTGANGSALKKSSSNTSDAELKGSAPLRKTSSPAPPPKPLALRSSNSESSRDTTASTSADHKKPPPPPTSRKPVTSSTSNQPNEAPPLPKRAPNLEGYGAVARQKISDTYQSLPSPALFWSGMGSRSRPSSPDRSPSEHFPPRNMSVSSSRSEAQSKPAPPPPPPPRRAISSYPAAAAQLASKRLSWNSPPASPKLSGVESDPHEPPLSQRERVWRERWMKAKQELEPRGVMLRSWRVGFDAMEDAMGLVERASKELDQTGGTSKAKQVER